MCRLVSKQSRRTHCINLGVNRRGNKSRFSGDFTRRTALLFSLLARTDWLAVIQLPPSFRRQRTITKSIKGGRNELERIEKYLGSLNRYIFLSSGSGEVIATVS